MNQLGKLWELLRDGGPQTRIVAAVVAAVLVGVVGVTGFVAQQAHYEILAGIGATRGDGSPVELELLEPYLDLLSEILRNEPEYRFGEDPELYDKIMAAGLERWSEVTDLRFPQDVIFVDRSLAGHFGNLMRFEAKGPWADIVESYARAV